MVDREVTYRFDDLERFEVVEKVVTLTCVSNPVGGDLISNATWTGYRVRDLLAEAGIHADADMVLSTSIDGFTAGTPVEALTDDRDSLLADRDERRNRCRSSTATPRAWSCPGCTATCRRPSGWSTSNSPGSTGPRRTGRSSGWSARGPIKTESRIDVPRSGAGRPNGSGDVRRRGVGAAPRRQGRRGAHRRRALAAGAAWARPTPTTPGGCGAFRGRPNGAGSHTITVRATDNTGAVQTEQGRRRPRRRDRLAHGVLLRRVTGKSHALAQARAYVGAP